MNAQRPIPAAAPSFAAPQPAPAPLPAPLPLQQSAEFARAVQAYGAGVVSHDPVVLERRIWPFGRVTFASRVTPEALSVRPRIINGETDAPHRYRALGYRQIITPAHVAEWDLTQPDLMRGLHPKWRNIWRKSDGLRLKVRPWNGMPHRLFAQAEAMARSRRFRALPTPLLACFAQTNPGQTLLVEAFDRGHLCAACLILRHGEGATYQTAWSDARGRSLGAARAVLVQAARHLAERGHSLLDLGTLDTELSPGLARFKLGTGAQVRALGGTWLRLR